nr:probable DNA replication complex GINS protein PSF3 [Ipomoea trifida]
MQKHKIGLNLGVYVTLNWTFDEFEFENERDVGAEIGGDVGAEFESDGGAKIGGDVGEEFEKSDGGVDKEVVNEGVCRQPETTVVDEHERNLSTVALAPPHTFTFSSSLSLAPSKQATLALTGILPDSQQAGSPHSSSRAASRESILQHRLLGFVSTQQSAIRRYWPEPVVYSSGKRQQLVPAVFQKTANAVGIFDCCDDMNKVGAGMEVEMPFWLARELYVKQAVKIKVPSCFDTKERPRDRHRDEPLKRRDRTKDEIGADAAHVDLRGRCPYFYDFGCKIARLICNFTAAVDMPCFRFFNREIVLCVLPNTFVLCRTGDKTIGPFLLVAFRTRYKEVLIKAYTAASAVASKHLTLLTQEEMKLYEAGQSSTMAFKKWRMGGPRLHKASVLGRKRKPTQ